MYTTTRWIRVPTRINQRVFLLVENLLELSNVWTYWNIWNNCWNIIFFSLYFLYYRHSTWYHQTKSIYLVHLGFHRYCPCYQLQSKRSRGHNLGSCKRSHRSNNYCFTRDQIWYGRSRQDRYFSFWRINY